MSNKFSADFSKWQASLKAAQDTLLPQLESIALELQEALTRLAASFQGCAVTRKAIVAAAAIRAVGDRKGNR